MPVKEGKAEIAKYAAMIAVGIVFFIIGALIPVAYGNRLRCTEPVTAMVEKNLEVKKVQNGKVRNERDIKYTPVFEYEYDGKKYSVISKISSRPPEFSEFEQVTIWVNPNDPEEIYYKPRGASAIMSIGFRFAGGSLALGGAAMLIVSKTKKKELL